MIEINSNCFVEKLNNFFIKIILHDETHIPVIHREMILSEVELKNIYKWYFKKE